MNIRNLSIFVAIAICGMLVAVAAPTAEELAKRQARSVHLAYDTDGKDAVAAIGTVKVTETQNNTYYAVLGWDCGYCGIQDSLAYGKILIFSVWDDTDPFDFKARPELTREDVRAKLIFADDGVNVSRFGGEGTGVRTITDIGWKLGEPVTIRIDRAADGTNQISYTCFYYKGDSKEWRKVAQISTLRNSKRGNGFGWLYSFVEDFWRNGTSATLMRRAEFSGIATRKQDSDKWMPVKRARFSADYNASMAIDAGALGEGAYYLQTGGATRNDHTKLGEVVK